MSATRELLGLDVPWHSLVAEVNDLRLWMVANDLDFDLDDLLSKPWHFEPEHEQMLAMRATGKVST